MYLLVISLTAVFTYPIACIIVSPQELRIHEGGIDWEKIKKMPIINSIFHFLLLLLLNNFYLKKLTLFTPT